MTDTMMIQTQYGPRSVRVAACSAYFAVTRMCGSPVLSGWRVTHIACGFAVPGYFATPAEAQIAARRLSMIDGAGSLTPRTAREWAQANRNAVRRALAGAVWADQDLPPRLGAVHCPCMEDADA